MLKHPMWWQSLLLQARLIGRYGTCSHTQSTRSNLHTSSNASCHVFALALARAIIHFILTILFILCNQFPHRLLFGNSSNSLRKFS